MPPKYTKHATTSMRLRLFFLVIVFCVVCVAALFIRLTWMQVYSYDYYNSKANQFQTRDTIITPARGSIYDTNDNILAVSATTEQITINPQQVVTDRNTANHWDEEEQYAEMAGMLSKTLGIGYDEVLKKVSQTDKMYQLIAIGVEKDVADEIREIITYGNEKDEDGDYYGDRFQFSGLTFEPDARRYYPYGNFASQAIGFLNSDGFGSSGLEYTYNTILSGTAGRMVRATDAKGNSMPYEYEEYIPAVDGADLVLHLDANIQNMVEKHLETMLADNPEARGGVSAIVMDVKTGGILAIANLDDFDPNEPKVIESERLLAELRENVLAAGAEAGLDANLLGTITDQYYQEGGTVNLTETQLENDALVDILSEERMLTLQKMWRNNLVSNCYEPGSTFKLFTVASAFEQSVIRADDTFYCGGSMMVDGWDLPINCHNTSGHGTQTLTETLKNSCNVAMMQIGFRMGSENIYRYFDAFGMTEKTGIDLPGEASPIFWSEYELRVTPSNLATMSFGQRINVTPMQELSMVAAIVDDGYLKTPQMVKEIRYDDGTISVLQPEVKRQVISEATSDFLCDAMLQVVSSGTGKNAYAAGYRIGGKTATSEIQKQAGDTEDRYTASFIGVAPMDDPQIAILAIASDLPASAVHGGSVVAAPVVGRLMTEILPYIGVEPIYTAEELQQQDLVMPDLSGKTAGQAQIELEKLGLNFRTLGEGDIIGDQLPAAGFKLQTDNTVILYMGDRTKSDELFEVPNVVGYQPDSVLYNVMMNNMFLNRTGVPMSQYDYKTTRIKQTPAAGTMVPAGTVVTVEFSSASNTNE